MSTGIELMLPFGLTGFFWRQDHGVFRLGLEVSLTPLNCGEKWVRLELGWWVLGVEWR